MIFFMLRTCPRRVNVRIFRHNFVSGKAKIRRRAVALQGFLTKSPAKFDEKTCMNPYVDRFSSLYVEQMGDCSESAPTNAYFPLKMCRGDVHIALLLIISFFGTLRLRFIPQPYFLPVLFGKHDGYLHHRVVGTVQKYPYEPFFVIAVVDVHVGLDKILAELFSYRLFGIAYG